MTQLAGGSAAPANSRAAVLGSPIAHSLSPALHRAAYASLGLAWRYDAIECDEAALPSLLNSLDDAFIGLSLTMPLKRAALPLLDDVTSLAAAVGAVNTVSFDGIGAARRRRGDNTDVTGLVESIRTAKSGALGTATILGAGGTAAAAVAALRELGVREVEVVVRDESRAVDLCAAADRLGMRVALVRWPGVGSVRAAELVISTVPAGAADRLVQSGDWTPAPGQVLFDVLYHPWPTPLALAAQAAGATVVDGLELLVRQAAGQVERWSGQAAPVEIMRVAGEKALRERESTR